MYEKIVLENGMRIVCQPLPGVRSATVGIWVGAGSRLEKPDEAGLSHFIEHMVFKGTAGRSAAQLAEIQDELGGQINAYTTKELTCFYGRVLDTRLKDAMELLCDMVLCPTLAKADIEVERGVVLEEIGMYEDSPEDLSAERLMAGCYAGSTLGRPILGRPAVLKKLTAAKLRSYMSETYIPCRMVAAVCGSYTAEDIEYLKSRFSALPAAKARSFAPAAYRSCVKVLEKPIEQTHITLAFPALSYAAQDRFALQLLNSIFGDGVSSRLFQSVREREGLCYSVYSFGASHAETGALCVYTAVNPAEQYRALKLIIEQTEKLKREGVAEQELERAREAHKTSLLLSLESSSARAARMGRGELLMDHAMSPDEVIAALDAVKSEDVLEMARRVFDFSLCSLSAVGKVGTPEKYKKIIRAFA